MKNENTQKENLLKKLNEIFNLIEMDKENFYKAISKKNPPDYKQFSYNTKKAS